MVPKETKYTNYSNRNTKEVAENKDSWTGKYLKKELDKFKKLI
jgi:hypothetical protein